jgi:AmiR/NasT family two-component response regulator
MGETSSCGVAVTFASAVVLNAAAICAQPTASVRQLLEAWRSWRTVNQASGILMVRYSCSDEEAFARLQLVAERADVTLLEAASVVVAGASGTVV